MRHRGHQLAGVVRQPGLARLAQVGGKRLLAPRGVGRVDDGGEGRRRDIAARMAHGQGQRAVAAH